MLRAFSFGLPSATIDWMNPHKFLVWEYSEKNNRWYDATEHVVWIKSDERAWAVKFENMEKVLHVSFDKIQFYDKPERVVFERVYKKDAPLYFVKSVIRFGPKCKIFYENGHTEVVEASDLVARNGDFGGLPKSDIFAYYYHASLFSAESEDDRFLADQFKNIATVPAESVLFSYLNGTIGENERPLDGPVLTPFSGNASQMKAIRCAFKNKISIIEGPPGTGKTQTILNLLVNALSNGYRTAVVSNNNAATDNVYEKLDALGYSFLCARLGNKENVDRFFENVDYSLPSLKSIDYDGKTRVENLKRFLNICYDKKNLRCTLIQEKEALELEQRHFLAENKVPPFTEKLFRRRVSGQAIMRALTILSENGRKLNPLARFKMRMALGGVRIAFGKSTAIEDPFVLKDAYYKRRLAEIGKEIAALDDFLTKANAEKLENEVRDASLGVFNQRLSEWYAEGRGKTAYGGKDYERHFDAFTHDFPIVLSSTYSLARCSKTGFLFDYVIVDESSQVNLASGILSMLMARNIVIVGDTKQLPQIDDAAFAEKDRYLMKKYGVPDCYDYMGNSLMTSLMRLYGNDVRSTLLREHYRCDPAIIGFCNKEFYGDQLIIASKGKNGNTPMRMVVLPKGNHARRNPVEGESGLYSEREADEIKRIVEETHPEDLGIISPYRAQVRAIENALGDKSIDVSTVHKFQGREKKEIILSTVVNQPNDFVDDPNLINVAVSRAVNRFTLVTSDGVAQGKSGILADLADYIRYHHEFSSVEEGKIHSIYDLLYEAYSKELAEFHKRHPSKGFDSERLTRELLAGIVSKPPFDVLRFSMHVSLRDIFDAGGLQLTSDETTFYRNPWSHADFVIYKKMNCQPVLVIEVDGVSYHEQKKEQKRRDSLKDSLLEKAKIPILRLKTNGSEEESKIRHALYLALE